MAPPHALHRMPFDLSLSPFEQPPCESQPVPPHCLCLFILDEHFGQEGLNSPMFFAFVFCKIMIFQDSLLTLDQASEDLVSLRVDEY
jgi:hypothetical protein